MENSNYNKELIVNYLKYLIIYIFENPEIWNYNKEIKNILKLKLKTRL